VLQSIIAKAVAQQEHAEPTGRAFFLCFFSSKLPAEAPLYFFVVVVGSDFLLSYCFYVLCLLHLYPDSNQSGTS
jgi:hypothetical protein